MKQSMILRAVSILVLAFCGNAAHATVVISNVNATSSEITFDVVGTVSKLGAGYHQQFGFGHVSDPSLDWISSFSSGSVVANAPTKQTVYGLYALTGSYGETIWSVSDSDWVLGDAIDLSYTLNGAFNLANFDIAGLGFQAGFSIGPAIEVENNLAAVSVPAPPLLGVFGFALIVLGALRGRRQVGLR